MRRQLALSRRATLTLIAPFSRHVERTWEIMT